MKFTQEIWLLSDSKPVIVGELDQNSILVAIFLSQNQMQVVVFLFSMLAMLPGFRLLGGLCHLADPNWGRDKDGETQDKERQPTSASYSVEGHELRLHSEDGPHYSIAHG